MYLERLASRPYPPSFLSSNGGRSSAPVSLIRVMDYKVIACAFIKEAIHNDFRGNTVVVHPTARPIENYRALQKGGARLVIHAMYYESRINMACRSFFLITITHK
jgi:hypothetical protein